MAGLSQAPWPRSALPLLLLLLVAPSPGAALNCMQDGDAVGMSWIWCTIECPIVKLSFQAKRLGKAGSAAYMYACAFVGGTGAVELLCTCLSTVANSF